MKSEPSTFWSTIGKFSAIVSTIGTLLGIWVILSEESEDLVLFVESHEYAIDPVLKESIASNFEAFSYENIDGMLEPEVEDFKRLNVIRNRIVKVHEDSWAPLSRFSYDKFRGFGKFYIKNKGTKEASDIKIDVPYGGGGLAVLYRSDQDPEVQIFDRVISVGNLRANNASRIEFWTKIGSISRYQYEDINLTHKNGLGQVIWDIPANPVGRFFQNFVFLLPLPLWLIFLLGTFAGSAGKASSDESNEQGAKEVENENSNKTGDDNSE